MKPTVLQQFAHIITWHYEGLESH